MVNKHKLLLINKEISVEDLGKQLMISKVTMNNILDLIKQSRKKSKPSKNAKIKEIENIFLEELENINWNSLGLNVKIIDMESELTILKSFNKINFSQDRIPVVSIMGHIDHGKTTLIDQIMKTQKVQSEVGGITQNISLYKIKKNDKEFFLIDTPGHETFSFLRNFIIQRTDILILLIAANDGISNQTIEIIKQSPNVEKIICINKIDLLEAHTKEKTLNRIYSQLASLGIVSSEYYGEVVTCQVSAKKNIGVEDLIQTILLKSEFMPLKSDRDNEVVGSVLDSQMVKGKGLITRILLKSGNMKTGDKFLCRAIEGNITRIFVENKVVNSADFNDLIDIVGFKESPEPGSDILCLSNEESHKKLRDFYKSIQPKNPNLSQEFKLILKAENINHLTTLEKTLENKFLIIKKSIGEITDSDMDYAATFNGIMILWGKSFSKNLEILQKKAIRFISNEIIYNLVDGLEKLIEKPKEQEFEKIGDAKILKVFNINGVSIAGCRILSGSVKKGFFCRVLRGEEIIGLGKVSSLKREKDNISEAVMNTECGIVFNRNIDFKPEDKIDILEEKI